MGDAAVLDLPLAWCQVAGPAFARYTTARKRMEFACFESPPPNRALFVIKAVSAVAIQRYISQSVLGAVSRQALLEPLR